jgi:hypothetical protein
MGNTCIGCGSKESCLQIALATNQSIFGNTEKSNDNKPLDREHMLGIVREVLCNRELCERKNEMDNGLKIIINNYKFTPEELGTNLDPIFKE